jgi:translation initiation factor 1
VKLCGSKKRRVLAVLCIWVAAGEMVSGYFLREEMLIIAFSYVNQKMIWNYGLSGAGGFMGDHRLVYSTDPKLKQHCPKCRELISECDCPRQAPIPDKISVTLRLERAKRGGKTVTVVEGLPVSKDFLQSLAADLKRSAASGGTFGIKASSGFIEIQGDRRDLLREQLRNKGISVKG